MEDKYGENYETRSPRLPALWPTPRFLGSIIFGPMLRLWWKARKNTISDADWVKESNAVANLLENLGGRIEVKGLASVRSHRKPCVFIANHMSTLETFLLPGMIRPSMPLTFVVKKSLATMPVFGPIMRSRNPVVVARANPREDLNTVLGEGVKRLEKGFSVVVFPQHTRTLFFDPAQFNTIGIKLAQKAGVAVIPIALKTDVWGPGGRIKELGPVKPALPARFQFGEAIEITGRGRNAHLDICQFIEHHLSKWQQSDGVNFGARSPQNTEVKS